MNPHQKQQFDYEFIIRNSLDLSFGKIGIEKESLRVLNQEISQKPHPAIWGSSLCNSFLTNDFSEAQPELITLPFTDNKKTLDFLQKLENSGNLNPDYDYSKVEYKNTGTKVILICKEHGEFLQTRPVLLGLKDKIRMINLIHFEHHFDDMIVKAYKLTDIHNLLTMNGFKKHFKIKMKFRKSFEYLYINKNYIS